ncbi:MAG TPA: permease prefix domain 2-containing transporter [Allosphingosinicella sp.]|nr:permease prefix domain 2-containing transporter [Allosphingosinicella sp.]
MNDPDDIKDFSGSGKIDVTALEDVEQGEWRVIVDGDTNMLVFVDDKGERTEVRAATLADVHGLVAMRNHGAHAADESTIEVKAAAPPLGETLIAIFCGPAMKEAILGDLAEKFEERTRERGEKNARIWYWWQVARSFGPFAWRWGRRAMELDDLRRLIGW